MNASRFAAATLMTLLPLAGGCGGGETAVAAPDPACYDVFGSGHTEGHVRALVGSGVFNFDGVERPAHVGVYLNDLRDIDRDRKEVTIVYQFTWENGDLMLTEDDVILWPMLEEGRYRFDENLTVKSGKGMFAGMEGERPFGFEGELRFGPPAPGQSLGSVLEEFVAGGVLCPG